MKEECSRCDKIIETKVPSMFCSDCVDEMVEIMVEQAKKEVFDDVQKYLNQASDRIPWQMLMAHGIKFEEPSPSWDKIKAKHLSDNSKKVKEE